MRRIERDGGDGERWGAMTEMVTGLTGLTGLTVLAGYYAYQRHNMTQLCNLVPLPPRLLIPPLARLFVSKLSIHTDNPTKFMDEKSKRLSQFCKGDKHFSPSTGLSTERPQEKLPPGLQSGEPDASNLTGWSRSPKSWCAISEDGRPYNFVPSVGQARTRWSASDFENQSHGESLLK